MKLRQRGTSPPCRPCYKVHRGRARLLELLRRLWTKILGRLRCWLNIRRCLRHQQRLLRLVSRCQRPRHLGWWSLTLRPRPKSLDRLLPDSRNTSAATDRNEAKPPSDAVPAPIPLQDIPRSAQPIPLQDVSRSAPTLGKSRDAAPLTPPRASHGARANDGLRTRTPPGTVAKAIAKFSPAIPSVPKFPQVFPMTPSDERAIAPRSSPMAALVQSAGPQVAMQDLVDLGTRIR